MLLHSGEFYVAFFNLKDENTTISANISELGAAYPGAGRGKYFRGCKGKEIFSQSTIKTIDTFSAEVPRHGCALFVLNCGVV